MKKLFSTLTIILALTCAFTTFNFYTKEKIKKHADEYANMACSYYHETDVPRTLNLADMLYGNIHVNAGTLAGLSTPQSYKDGWRATIVNHPEYLHTAVTLYGKYFMDEYKSSITNYYKQLVSPDANWRVAPKFEKDTFPNIIIEHENGIESGFTIIPKSKATDEEKELALKQEKNKFQINLNWWRKDSADFAKELKAFSITNYWKEQRIILSKYRSLIKKMLLLDDKTLNMYIKSAGDKNPETVKPLHTWLYKQKIISMIPVLDSSGRQTEESYRTWYCWYYPCDLIFLTHRICRDYPRQWTARKFLVESDKIIAEIDPLLPK